MKWLDKLKDYAPSIAGAILSGGATLPQLAMKAVADATGIEISNETDLSSAVTSATPEMMLKIKQADNSFTIQMRQLDNELTSTELGDTQHAREQHQHSKMPAILCCVLTLGIILFTTALLFVTIPESNTRLIDMLFGAYLTAWLSTVAYWVGTTRTSADKDKRK